MLLLSNPTSNGWVKFLNIQEANFKILNKKSVQIERLFYLIYSESKSLF